MTEKPKKQLFNPLVKILGLFLAPIVVLFFFLTTSSPSSLYILALGILCILFYLISLKGRMDKSKSQFELNFQNFRERKNLMEAEIDRQQGIIDAFQKKIVNYSQLKGLTERLGLCLNLEETSRMISSEVNKFFKDIEITVILYVFHSKTGELGISSSQKGQMSINLKSKKGDELDQWVVRTMQPLLIEDAKNDYRFDTDKIKSDEPRVIRSLISVPLMIGQKAIGILRVDGPRKEQFALEDLRFLTAIGDLSAVAIENAQLYESVEQLAIKDSLTGLYLRRFVMEKMPSEISRHLRRKKDLSLLMIDVDYFKNYNDKFGHIAGDILLKAVGKLLLKTFHEPGNLCCRYGGEEFAIVLNECTKKRALELAEGFRKDVEKLDIMLRRRKTNVTVSVGIATFPKDAHNDKELIHYADMALYEAKNKGRNRVVAAKG